MLLGEGLLGACEGERHRHGRDNRQRERRAMQGRTNGRQAGAAAQDAPTYRRDPRYRDPR